MANYEINNEQPKISRSEYAYIINSIDKFNIFLFNHIIYFINRSNNKSYILLKILLKKVVQSIKNILWDRAKSIWVLEICKLQPKPRRTFDYVNSEYENFIRYINRLQEYQLYCENSDCELFCS